MNENFWILISFILFSILFIKFFWNNIVSFIRKAKQDILGDLPNIKREINSIEKQLHSLNQEMKNVKKNCQDRLLVKQNFINEMITTRKDILLKISHEKDQALQMRLDNFKRNEYEKIQSQILKLAVNLSIKYSRLHNAKHKNNILTLIEHISN